MLNKIINAIDNQNWTELESYAVCMPDKFFASFNVRGLRAIGVKRRIWLTAKCDSLRELPIQGKLGDEAIFFPDIHRAQVIAEQILSCIIH